MSVEWCGCAHAREDHPDNGRCTGVMVFDFGTSTLAPGEDPIEAPCACEGFKFWYADGDPKGGAS